MKKLFVLFLAVGVGVQIGRMLESGSRIAAAGGGQGGGVENCVAKNGDVNADDKINLGDAITILGHLFQGSPTELAGLCAPTPAPSGLPDTGQRICYDESGTEIPCVGPGCRGQDGSYSKGCLPEGRFTDNGDGTVTDNCTGLMWQKGRAPETVSWCGALAYCESLSLGGGLPAWEDWRLPNVRELQSLADYGRSTPAIDPVFNAAPAFYWSSTTNAISPGFGWGVNFSHGIVGNGVTKNTTNHVRAVRGGP